MPSASATVEHPGAARPPVRSLAVVARGLLTLIRRAFWPSAIGLVALNGWWAWENRPLTDLRVVGGWVEAGRLDEAEAALRDWVQRVPDSPDARMLLARVLATRDDLVGCAAQLQGVPFWAPQKNEALFREAQSWQKVDRARD